METPKQNGILNVLQDVASTSNLNQLKRSPLEGPKGLLLSFA